MDFKGVVFSGMGKGRYYVGHPEFKKRFEVVLGYTPYPGTLNIRLLEASEVEKRRRLRETDGESILAFEYMGERLSAVKCFDGKMAGRRVTLVIPKITEYDDSVAELIAPERLRDSLHLKDSQLVRFSVSSTVVPSADSHRNNGPI